MTGLSEKRFLLAPKRLFLAIMPVSTRNVMQNALNFGRFPDLGADILMNIMDNLKTQKARNEPYDLLDKAY